MALLQVILFLLLCAVALGWVARHFQFPYPIALVIGGGALGFVPRLPQLQFDPQFLLVLVLPPILYQAALLTSWRDFKANIRPIGLLAIGLVIVTTLAVGATLKFLIPDIPWAAAFVLGAIVSPPDAVAATAILSRLNIPRRVVTVLEGESLVNDATGLVIYKFAVAAVLTGAFSLWQASLEFVGVAVGGALRLHPPLSRGRLHRGADHARRALRRLHPRGIAAPVGRARRGRRGPGARALRSGDRLRRDAHHRALGVEPARVPAEQPDFHPHRHAAFGDRLEAHRLLVGAAFPLRRVRERGRSHRALRLGLPGDLPVAHVQGLARPVRRAASRR